MANYPTSLKNFKTHQDLTDVIYGADMNTVQDELEAVQSTLGVYPYRFADAQAQTTDFYSEITGLPGNDTGGLETDVLGMLIDYAKADRSIRTNTVVYSSVSDRLDDIQRGGQTHCFELTARSITVSPSAGSAVDNRPKGIRFPRSTVGNDPFSMHNGIGVTLKKGGYWRFTASVIYNLQTAVQANWTGMYNGAIDVDGDWLKGMARFEHQSNNQLVIMQPVREGFFDRGARVTLRTSHNAPVDHVVRLAGLAGSLVREG